MSRNLKITVLWSVVTLLLLFLAVALLITTGIVNNPLGPDAGQAIEQVRAMNRLESVHYTLQFVISMENAPRNFVTDVFGDSVFKEKILLIAYGEVIAGVDLSKLKDSDFSVSGKAVHLLLPPAEILHQRLDSQRTSTYDYQKGLFATNSLNINDEVRREAEKMMIDFALKDGILAKARANAQENLTSLFKVLGFTEVTFESAPLTPTSAIISTSVVITP